MDKLIRAYKDYQGICDDMYYWVPSGRSRVEVDFILFRGADLINGLLRGYPPFLKKPLTHSDFCAMKKEHVHGLKLHRNKTRQEVPQMNSGADNRESGIALIGDLPWGSHFCQFYQTKEDLLDILIPYFKAGLENNEYCVWVTSDFFTSEEALEALKISVPGFSEYLARGQMEIFPYTDWYLIGGNFDLQRTLDMWMEKHDEALSKGFAGVRVSGNPYWIDNKKDWDDFAAYEAEINNVIGGTKLLVLCTYSLEKCGVVEILDVIRNHEFALAMNRGSWQVVSTPQMAVGS
jgi:hypothetical protein